MTKVGGPGVKRPTRAGQMRRAAPAKLASSEGTARWWASGVRARSAVSAADRDSRRSYPIISPFRPILGLTF